MLAASSNTYAHGLIEGAWDNTLSMLLTLRNPFESHEKFLFLQPMFQTKRFDIISPLLDGCSEILGVFIFIFKHHVRWVLLREVAQAV